MKRSKSRFAEPGSISSGTMRHEDLIPEFLAVAETLQLRREDAKSVRAIRKRSEEEDYFETEEADWDMEALFDLLGAYAPPFCYFGAHEGDGTDYGFWYSDEALREAIEEGEVSEGDTCPRSATYRVVISDHGNVSLYYRNGREVWGIV